MDAYSKAIYWTAAFLNMTLIIGFGLIGVRDIRRRHVALHRRRMLTGGSLVIAFLVSYLFKALLLGREQLELWTSIHIYTLRFHETCVAAMLLAGGVAYYLATRLELAAPAMDPEKQPDDDSPHFARRVRWHRYAGWTSIGSGVLGLTAALVVLYGMYARL
ncbi:MAG: DUF420 domain-containing protein [bacterium]|nr:DUF420 domain-containing protein [bacterium]